MIFSISSKTFSRFYSFPKDIFATILDIWGGEAGNNFEINEYLLKTK